MSEEDSPIIDFYPEDFLIDLNGHSAKQAWLGNYPHELHINSHMNYCVDYHMDSHVNWLIRCGITLLH